MKLKTPNLMLCTGVLLFLPLALHSKISAKQYATPIPLTDTPPNWIASENGGMTKAQTATTNSPYVRFNEAASNLSAAKLPEAVASALASAVLQEASQRTGLPISQLRVEKFQRIEGSRGCPNLPRPNEVCTGDAAQLWQVTVVGGQQRLVYDTNLNGSYIKLNEAASELGEVKLPNAVASAVLREVSQRTGLPTSRLRIEKFQRIQGSSSCLGLPPRFGEFCSADLVHLWQVTVAGGQQRLVYHTNLDGSKIKLNQTARISIP